MWGTLMAVVVAATIIGSSVDAFAMAGGGGRKRGGSGGAGETTYTSYQEGSWQYSSQYVASAPEPGTIILLASGVAGLALWVRRRK